MSVHTVALDGLEITVTDVPNVLDVRPGPDDRPVALWTRQVIAGGNVRAVVRKIDPDTSFDEVHRIAERVAGALGIGAADVAFSVEQ